MPKTLADGTIKLSVMSTKPADPTAPTTTELAAGLDAACSVLSSDFTLGPTDSDKIAEKALCQEGNSNALGPSNFTGRLTLFRYFDAGVAEDPEDDIYQALKAKGARVWIAVRQTSKKSTVAWAATDEVDVYEVITDNPQMPSDQGGYIKRVIPLEVQDAWLNGTVAAGA